jgi:hypothetical protein
VVAAEKLLAALLMWSTVNASEQDSESTPGVVRDETTQEDNPRDEYTNPPSITRGEIANGEAWRKVEELLQAVANGEVEWRNIMRGNVKDGKHTLGEHLLAKHESLEVNKPTLTINGYGITLDNQLPEEQAIGWYKRL